MVPRLRSQRLPAGADAGVHGMVPGLRSVPKASRAPAAGSSSYGSDADAGALGGNPCRGTRRDEISPGLRVIPGAGKGVVAFDVKEDTRTVRILSITWGGADWMGTVAGRAARGRG